MNFINNLLKKNIGNNSSDSDFIHFHENEIFQAVSITNTFSGTNSIEKPLGTSVINLKEPEGNGFNFIIVFCEKKNDVELVKNVKELIKNNKLCKKDETKIKDGLIEALIKEENATVGLVTEQKIYILSKKHTIENDDVEEIEKNMAYVHLVKSKEKKKKKKNKTNPHNLSSIEFFQYMLYEIKFVLLTNFGLQKNSIFGLKKQHASEIFYSFLKQEEKINKKKRENDESLVLRNACKRFLKLCFKERIKQKRDGSTTIRITLLNFKEKNLQNY